MTLPKWHFILSLKIELGFLRLQLVDTTHQPLKLELVPSGLHVTNQIVFSINEELILY